MQAAISAASWVVGKALSPVVDGFLEAWAASAGLGPNVDALKLQLLYAQAMLTNARGREIENPALNELLHKLRELAYNADDVLDELEYFRIQDELQGTYHAAADVDAAAGGGCVHGLVLNARHACRAVATKLQLTSRAAAHGPDHEQDDDDGATKQGWCLSCGGRAAAASSSSPPLPTQHGGEIVRSGCMPKLTSSARNTAHTVGKRLSCCFSPSVGDDAHHSALSCFRFCAGASSKAQQRKHGMETPPPLLKFDRVEISRKMKDIVEQLKPVCAMVSTILNLEPRTTKKDIAMSRPITTSSIIEPKLYGRDDQFKSIVDGITHGQYSTSKLTVLPIVGHGGIGKTTLAQHVYHQVKSHFHVLIWICVSQNFNANRLVLEAVKKIPKVDGENQNASEEEKIEQRLKSKRFLLVLDDIWTCQEDEWKKLLAEFSKGGERGNMVIVTSRFPEVAKMVQTDDCLIELGSLGPKDFMVFFGVCVFGHQSWEGHDEFLETGKEIVKKLKGSPLAAKTVGRLLRNQLTLEHWERVLESKEWELQTNENDIMPALKLSYDYLPFHLQQCFSYCALFPEDYEFDSDELIHLWIGLDILHSGDRKKGIEDVGQSYLDDLVKFAFLKKNETDSGCPYYVVHDLLHELAVKVSSYECLSLSSSNVRSIQIPTSVRHLSITINDEDVKDRVTLEHYKKEFSAVGKRLKVENIRTLLMFGELQECFIKTFCDLFREARALRTILCQSSYNVEDLFPNFSELVHLRYSRIEGDLITLPYSISRLYQIKVLDVQGCSYTSSLPIDISNLINLRHFIVSDADLHANISEVGKLKHLKELSRFEVKKENDCFKLKQLGQLQELQVLGIYNLENVETKEEAGEANLSQKTHLQELILEWDIERTDEQSVQEENILECLKPHRNLRKLCIRGHGGVKCPTWLGVNLSVRNLEYLCLDLVAWEKLPLPLGGLHMLNEHCEDCPSQSFINLKRLELVCIQNLEKWVQHGSSHLFPHLEKLVIKHCLELLELSFSHPSGHQPVERAGDMDWFPSLQDLEIIHCPKLLHVHPSCHQQAGKVGNMDCFPSLQKLKIEYCPKLLWVPTIPWTDAPCSADIQEVGSDFECLHYIKGSDFRYELYITGKDVQERSLWNSLAFPNLSELTSLKMNKCPPLPFHLLQMLPSLKSLIVWDPSSSFLVGEGESHVKYKFPVESIEIMWCGTGGKELTRLLLSYFPKLTSLNIKYCQKITGLGVVQQQIQSKSTSLPSSSANEEESTQMIQEQHDTRGEEEVAASDAEGLLLLPPQLQELRIIGCREVSLQPSNKETGGTGGGLQGLRFLRLLEIIGCPNLFSYPFPLPSSLQDLRLCRIRGTEALVVPLSNLTSLESLMVLDCWDLRFHGLWPLLTQGRLTKLSVKENPSFFVCSEASWLDEQALSFVSSKLQYLNTDDAPRVLSATICSLLSSSLTTLYIVFDTKTECFTKEQEDALQLLTSLRDLEFIYCTKLQHLPAGLHRLANLKTLSIHSCPAIRSLPMNSLPNSLQKLEIVSCEALSSLGKDGLPSSPQELSINCCPAIRSLPKVERLPNSLRIIEVYNSKSDELIRQCRKLKGTVPIVRA